MKILFTFIILLFFGPLFAQDGWHKQSIPTTQYLSGIFFINKDTGWTGGEEGLYWTTNGGDVWSLLTTKFVSKPTFVDAKNGWAITSNKTVGKTTDGGLTWKDTLTPQQGGINQIQVFGIDTVYISGDVDFVRTTDGGKTWVMTEGIELGNTTYFVNTKIGFACGDNMSWFGDFPPSQGTQGALFKYTVDGGYTWNTKFPFFEGSITKGIEEILRKIYAHDSMNIIAIGETQLFYSSNAGASWKSGSPMGAFNGLCFVNSKIGYVVGYSGQIYYTADSAHTWTPQNSTVSTRINSVTFVDSLNGWCCGDLGVILHTTDGGKLWTRQYLPQPLTTSVSPEPFSRRTSISYELPKASKVHIRIYDALGKELEVLGSDGILESGTHNIDFDGSKYPEGTFYYRIETDSYIGTGKMTKIVY